MEVIDDLLRIKQFREQKAEVALAKTRLALAAAVAALEQARAALTDCRNECDRRQRALYADLFARLVQRTDIDAVLVEVESMKEEIKRAEEVVEQKKTARDQAEKRCDDARLAHQLAMRGREKFTELSEQAGLLIQREGHRKEDSEMEEVRAPVAETDDEEPEFAQPDGVAA